MAIPDSAIRFEYIADPADRLEYVAQFNVAGPNGEPKVLEDGEIIDEIIEVAPLPDSAALGLMVLDGTVDGRDRGPFIADDTQIEWWQTIEEESRADPAFDKEGSWVGVQISFRTDRDRDYQVTYIHKVKQK